MQKTWSLSTAPSSAEMNTPAAIALEISARLGPRSSSISKNERIVAAMSEREETATELESFHAAREILINLYVVMCDERAIDAYMR